MQNSFAMNDGRGTSDQEGRSEDSRAAERRGQPRRPYEPPRIERRIPVAANTMQGTSGGSQFFEDE